MPAKKTATKKETSTEEQLTCGYCGETSFERTTPGIIKCKNCGQMHADLTFVPEIKEDI